MPNFIECKIVSIELYVPLILGWLVVITVLLSRWWWIDGIFVSWSLWLQETFLHMLLFSLVYMTCLTWKKC